jgi:hypothetical protein
MFKKIAILTLLSSSIILSAELLEVSPDVSNLEIMLDSSCDESASTDSTDTEKLKKVQVETVSYSVFNCNTVASYPVTVRKKSTGENN